MRYVGIVPVAALQLVGSGGGGPSADVQTVPIVPGSYYELWASGVVYVRAGSGDALRVNDLQVAPGAPLRFIADKTSLTVAAGGPDCFVYLLEESTP